MKICHLFIESHNTKTKVTTQNVPWSFPTLYDAMGCSTSGLPVLHQLLKFAQTHVHKSVMTFNHLVLCHPLLLLPSIFPKLRDFSKELALHIPCGLAGKKICLQCRRPWFDPWVGKIPWGRERLPTQYYGLGNSMDCIVHGVSKSQTRLSNLHFHFQLFTSGGQSIGA